MTAPEVWVTVREAAHRLDKSQRTIRRWIADNDIPVDRTQHPMRVDIGGRLDDIGVTKRPDDTTQPSDDVTSAPDDVTPPKDDTTPPDTPPAGEILRLRERIAELEGQITHLKATNEGHEAETQALRSEVDHLEKTNALLQDLLNEVREERDYLRSMNAAQLAKIPDRGPSIWRRLLPWVGREDEG